ncbi:hypothetical protein SPHINGO8BC_140159 [Sphingobacterium multivorum]|uniref:Uncharacterized protein n=1 Tax=Sphingobacterium multivorum TaxID=28454 RepID=A0A653ZGB6_SPHMU|nr:hypothetical protein SPHINGO8BC_140159 [Sphingobacterium multivorum]
MKVLLLRRKKIRTKWRKLTKRSHTSDSNFEDIQKNMITPTSDKNNLLSRSVYLFNITFKHIRPLRSAA